MLIICFYFQLVGQQTYEKAYYIENEYSLHLGYFPIFVTQFPNNDYVFGGNKIITAESNCSFITKVDSSGNPIYSKVIEQPGANNIINTSDGGFLITSTSYGYLSNKEIILIKVDEMFDTVWTKSIGSDDIYDNSITKGILTKEINNNCYLTVGMSNAFGAGGYDTFIVKTDFGGNIIWTKTIGSDKNEYIRDFIQTDDNGFIFCGIIDYVLDAGNGIFLTKLDSLGNLKWTRVFNGNKNHNPRKINLTNDNCFIVFSELYSLGSDRDILIFKTDSNGNILWSNSYGNSLDDFGSDIICLSNDSYVFTASLQDPVSSEYNISLIKIDNFGEVLWSKKYGGEFSCQAGRVSRTNDGVFVIIGNTTRNFGNGNKDYPILIKTDYNGNTNCNNNISLNMSNYTIEIGSLEFQIVNEGNSRSLTECNIENVIMTDSLLCDFTQKISSNMDDISVSVYPNPFHYSTNIILDTPKTSSYSVDLYNCLGQLVFSITDIEDNSIMLNKGNLIEGIYILNISDNTKIVKQIKIIIK